MKASFTCDYLHNSGNICGKACICPEGCHIHFKAKKRFPCSNCGKSTNIDNGLCSDCNKSNYQILYVKRLWDKAQMFNQYCKEVR